MKTRLTHRCARPILESLWIALWLFTLPLAIQAQSAPCCPPVAGTKWLQPPDVSTRYNALEITTASPYIIGDDFLCTNTGPISDIRLWGTFFNDNDLYLNDMAFTLTIWSDASGGGAAPNHPGIVLWSQTFQPGQYNWCVMTNTYGVIITPGYFPAGPSSTNLYELCFAPPSTNPFVQTGSPAAPINYWLTVTTQLQGIGDTTQFAWKTSASNYNATAVYLQGAPPWTPIYNLFNGNSPVNLAFQITTANSLPAFLNPLSIQYLSPGNFVLTWDEGILQELNLSNLATPTAPTMYVDVPGATSPYTNNTSLTAQLFRLRSN